MIKNWSLDNKYIVEMITTCKSLTVVRAFDNIQKKFKNRSLVWPNDFLITKSIEVTPEMMSLMIYPLL